MGWERRAPPAAQPQQPLPTVCIGVPHTGMCPVDFTFAYRALDIPQPFLQIKMAGQPVDIARNLVAKQFLNTPAQFLFFIDTDVILGKDVGNHVEPDATALKRMLSHNVPILTGIYYRRSDPPVPGIYKYFPDMTPAPGHRPFMQYPPSGLFEVDAVGAGCMLIRRDVFMKVPYPWFKFGEIDANEFSEDFYFTHKAKHYGFPTLCDPTVQCKHLLLLAVDKYGIATANM